MRHEYELTETERQCHVCEAPMHCIGEDKSEQLAIIPAQMYVVEHARKKYACKHCQEGVKISNPPPQPIPKCQADASMLSHITISKFLDSLPLYRQERILKRSGVELNRSTLANWVHKSAVVLSPLVKIMRDKIIEHDISFSDETPVQVLKEKNRRPEQKSYMWVFLGGEESKRSIIYQYHPTRSATIPETFFDGFKGYLHVDGYPGYNRLCSEEIIKVSCWAHVRRYFVDIIKSNSKLKTGSLAAEAVGMIKALYKIEREAKDRQYTPIQRHALRQQESKPILFKFKQWLDEKQMAAPRSSQIYKAIHYALNHWSSLLTYLQDGRLEMDNNETERWIKAFVIGRKNWLFYDSPTGAWAGAIHYSLIQTCKYHQLDPFLWMRYALNEMPRARTRDEIEILLPYNIDHSVLYKSFESDYKQLMRAIAMHHC